MKDFLAFDYKSGMNGFIGLVVSVPFYCSPPIRMNKEDAHILKETLTSFPKGLSIMHWVSVMKWEEEESLKSPCQSMLGSLTDPHRLQ